ncbi:MAG: hypothetical protein ACF788_09610 [Novipirellula sp. JB048]
MLEVDYPQRLSSLIERVSWDIQLPEQWPDYFAGNGETSPAFPGDERSSQRVSIRTRSLAWAEVALPFRQRANDPIGIYTRDFSKTGSGFLTPIEFYPEEELRIVLPAFWVRVRVVRSRRIGQRCFEVGARLLQKYAPSSEAFGPSLTAVAK